MQWLLFEEKTNDITPQIAVCEDTDKDDKIPSGLNIGNKKSPGLLQPGDPSYLVS
jgi:hypothetical protein